MDIREYLAVRRAYALVRQSLPSADRLTFEEYAILAKLAECGTSLATSYIADWQHALRPTMTHRANRLEDRKLIIRSVGENDRRNILCTLSDKGAATLAELTALTRASLRTGDVLSRITDERILKYVLAMGSVFLRAQDLILVAIRAHGADDVSVSELVASLGLLQPTVSMSVAALEDEGLATRGDRASRTGQPSIGLTPTGAAAGDEIAGQIADIIVTRKPRKQA